MSAQGLTEGRVYSVYVPRETVMVGTYEGTATLGGVGGYWTFKVPDDGFGGETHTVYVNPSMVATVIPEWRKS